MTVSLALASWACAAPAVPSDLSAITPIPGIPTIPLGLDTGDATPEVLPTLVPLIQVPTDAGGAPPVATPAPAVAGTFPTVPVLGSPTPDPTRATTLQRTAIEEYTIQRGDTLNVIASRYGVSAEDIATLNTITISDTLFVGQVLRIPLPEAPVFGPDDKLIPDSELVFGPSAAGFDVAGFIAAQGGYLASYTEDVPGYALDGQTEFRNLTAAEIITVISGRYSVNPRLLLAMLEFQSGWVTNPTPAESTLNYPLRRVEQGREGLFRQLTWTANQLNQGFYGWRAGWLVSFSFNAGVNRVIAPTLNAGTVGVQSMLARVLGPDEWQRAVGDGQFAAAYASLFGDPFRFAVEPLVTPGLGQPELQLPFEPNKVWAFTGGPHGAFDTGSAWAALDFAPPAEAEGCLRSDEWAVAAAPGVVVRSEYGLVTLDLDGDGFEGTGWVLTYFHIESRDRVSVGTVLAAGDRIGHPSCEGGVSNGTHLHLSRKFNGVWIEADGELPFVLDGWSSTGLNGVEYDGTLRKGNRVIEACNCREDGNAIARP